MSLMRNVISLFIGIYFVSPSISQAKESSGNVVQIAGVKGQWGLVVNGKPFVLKGVGVGRATGRDGKTDFLKMARDLGANTVRTWGIEQGTKAYLDRAHDYGLYVDAGIWLNPVSSDGRCSYITDKGYQKAVRAQALNYVRKFKDHPAILFWNIGNETIFWTKNEQERVGFCRFLESLIQEVHAIDPRHPVVYASAFTTAVPYIKQYVPSLDILGVNVYGGLDEVQRKVSTELNIPYLITEFGPTGNWDAAKDVNGVSYEATDQLKAQNYKQFAAQIKGFYGTCLGGFAFYLGDTTQVSFSWWNMNQGQLKKFSYWTIEDFYKERAFRPAPFLVKNVLLSKKVLKPNEEFQITVDLSNPSKQAVQYEYFSSTASEESYLKEFPNKKVPLKVLGDGPVVTVRAPKARGVYRVYAVVSDGDYATMFNKSIRVGERK